MHFSPSACGWDNSPLVDRPGDAHFAVTAAAVAAAAGRNLGLGRLDVGRGLVGHRGS